MKRIHWSLVMFTGVVVAGCGASQVNRGAESSAAAIRAAEEMGAASVPRASLLLQLAKEESAKAQALTAAGDTEEAASMQKRAEADGNLAVTIARAEGERAAAATAEERLRKLRAGGQ